MGWHLHREIEKLKRQIILLGGLVEKSFGQTLHALERRDAELAQTVHDSDNEVDYREVDIEEECLKTLALYQPVATDLRLIVAILKINSDLERIGDEVAHIAGRAITIAAAPLVDVPWDFVELGRQVQRMVSASLDALINLDSTIAQKVRQDDHAVDTQVNATFAAIKEKMRRQPERLDLWIDHLRINRHLERIADHATNIAEDVLYMIEGQIVRHRP